MKQFFWKVLLALSFILLVAGRIPSLAEPKWYGDEGVYMAVGHHLRAGGLLYQDAWENKPPLLLLLYYGADFFGRFNLVAIRALSLAFSVLAAIALFKVARELFPQKPAAAYLATIGLNLLLTTPLLEANIANAENFFMIFMLVGIWLVLRAQRGQISSRLLIAAGAFFSLAVLTKVSPLVEVAGVVFYLVVEWWQSKVDMVTVLKRISYLLAGFVIPILAVIFYFTYHGLFFEFAYSALLFGLFYVKGAGPTWLLVPMIPNTLATRGLLLVTFLVGVAVLRFRGFCSRSPFLTSVWLGCAAFASLLSIRGYPHYLLELLPPLVLFISTLVVSINRTWKVAYLPAFYVVWVVFVRLFTGGQPLKDHSPDNYYALFRDYLTGKVSRREFNDTFNWRVNAALDLKQVLEVRYPGQKAVWFWDDFPWIYDLADVYSPVRFFTNYHAFWTPWTTASALADLSAGPPQLIVVREELEVDERLREVLEDHYVRDHEWKGYGFYSSVVPQSGQT